MCSDYSRYFRIPFCSRRKLSLSTLRRFCKRAAATHDSAAQTPQIVFGFGFVLLCADFKSARLSCKLSNSSRIIPGNRSMLSLVRTKNSLTIRLSISSGSQLSFDSVMSPRPGIILLVVNERCALYLANLAAFLCANASPLVEDAMYLLVEDAMYARAFSILHAPGNIFPSCVSVMDVSPIIMSGVNRSLGSYYMSLQSKYGDPRVYASQEEQMRRDAAAVMHAKSKRTEQLLEDAYARQTERNRAQHSDRLRNREQRGRLRSSAARGQRRNEEPPPEGSSPSDQAAPARS